MVSHKVPAIDRTILEEDGTHLTVRIENESGRRNIEHVQARYLDFGWFTDKSIPVRKSANYRKRRNRIGHLWMATTATSVQFESLLERSLLLDLDYNPTVSRVWGQPFRVDGIDSERDDRKVAVYPDLLVQYEDGSLEVIEVKPEWALQRPDLCDFDDDLETYAKAVERWEKMTANFAFLRRECDQLGWKFSIRSELTDQRRKNLEYISAYRNLREKDPLMGEVLSLAGELGPVGVAELAAETSGGFVSAMPVVLHLAWHHRLEIDLDEPLCSSTVVCLPAEERQLLEVAA